MPPEGMSRERYLAAKFSAARSPAQSQARLIAAGRGEGIDFALDRIRRTPNTLRAHRLVRLAAAAGDADDLVEAMFRAYFLDGLDLGDIDTLAALAAAAAGLDEGETRRWLAGDALSEEILAEDRRARRLGIHAVPCFVIDGGYALSGAQEPEMFLPLFDLASAATTPAAG
jgi:predicted DsbA family dithiol-disulfide isomerase